MSFYVSTHIDDSLVVDNFYGSCVVRSRDFDTWVDLIMLDIMDFDVILGIDGWSPYYTVLDYFSKTVILDMPSIPTIVWQGSFVYAMIGIISYNWARRLVLKFVSLLLLLFMIFVLGVPCLISFLLFVSISISSLLTYMAFLLGVILSLLLILHWAPNLFPWILTIWILPSLTS